MRNNKRNNKQLRPCVTVTAEECHGNVDKMIRRVIKKVKNDGIVEEYRDRTRFKKPSVIRTEKKRDKRRLLEKVLKRQRELFSTTGRSQPKHRKGRG